MLSEVVLVVTGVVFFSLRFHFFPHGTAVSKPRRENICCAHLQQHNDLSVAHRGAVTQWCRCFGEMLRADDALLGGHTPSRQRTMGISAP